MKNIKKLFIFTAVIAVLLFCMTGCKTEEKKTVDISDANNDVSPTTEQANVSDTDTQVTDKPDPANDETPVPTEETTVPTEEIPEPTEETPEPTEEPEGALPKGWRTEHEDFTFDDVTGYEDKIFDELDRPREIIERKWCETPGAEFAFEFKEFYTYTEGSYEVAYREEIREYELGWEKVKSKGSAVTTYTMESPDNRIELYCGWSWKEEFGTYEDGAKKMKADSCSGSEFDPNGNKVCDIKDYPVTDPETLDLPEGVVGKWKGTGIPKNGGTPIDLTIIIYEDGTGKYWFVQGDYEESFPFYVNWDSDTFSLDTPEGNKLGIDGCGGYWALEDGILKLDIYTSFKNGSSYSYTAECEKVE